MLIVTVIPEEGLTRSIVSGTTAVSIDVVVQETDPTLPFQQVGVTIDWNDGQQPVHYPALNAEQASPLVLMNLARTLGIGVYAVTITAHNNRAPVQDTVKTVVPITISQLGRIADPPRNLFGPVLPRDDGLPNNQTWMFDMGSDLQVLQSNIKMLLITGKGERIMQPDYGTNIRRMIFELKVAAMEVILQQEITQAINAYEPRVTLQELQVNRRADDPRSVNVICSFLSRQNGQPFDVNLQFSR